MLDGQGSPLRFRYTSLCSPRVLSHPERPGWAGDRDTLADLALLKPAAIEAPESEGLYWGHWLMAEGLELVVTHSLRIAADYFVFNGL